MESFTSNPSSHNNLYSGNKHIHAIDPIVCKKFDVFLSKVYTKAKENLRIDMPDPDPCLLEFLRKAKQGVNSSMSEEAVQLNSFGYLKVFGDVVFENTSQGVKNFKTIIKKPKKKNNYQNDDQNEVTACSDATIDEEVQVKLRDISINDKNSSSNITKNKPKKNKKDVNNEQVCQFSKETIISAEEYQFDTDFIGNDFRKLCFTRIDETAKRPDMIVRMRHPQDTCDVATLNDFITGDLASSTRVAPWSIVSLVEFKKLNENLSGHVTQCAEYCSNLLKISPQRKVTFCALTNFVEIIFVGAYMEHKEGNTCARFVQSAIINDGQTDAKKSSEEWCLQMAQFLSADKHVLGFIDTIHNLYTNGEIEMVQALGRGSTSAVVEIKLYDHLYQILKISRDSDALSNEVRVTSNIRKAVDSKDVDLFPQCRIFSKEYNFLSLHATKFDKITCLGPDGIVSLWEMVKLYHGVGYVHRDIRFPNIVKTPKSSIATTATSSSAHVSKVKAEKVNLTLIDYSSAHNPEGICDDLKIPPGSLIHASYKTIDSLYSNQDTITKRYSGNYQCGYNDEVISLIILALHHHSEFKNLFNTYNPRDGNTAREIINDMLDVVDALLPVKKKKSMKGKLKEYVDRLDSNDPTVTAADRDLIVKDAMKILKCVWKKRM